MTMNKGDEVLNQFTPQQQQAAVDTSRRLKVGIIGTGWIAESHIKSYLNMPDADVVAMADLIPGKAEAFAEKFGVKNCRFYPDHKSMLEHEQLDAVSICTYNVTHAQCTIDALDAGVNVLLEKPMCVTTQEAVDIIGPKSAAASCCPSVPAAHGSQHADDQKDRAVRSARRNLLHPNGRRPAQGHPPTAPLSKKRRPASARWAISAAIRWIWC